MNSSINDQRADERFNCGSPVVVENCETGDLYDGSMYNYSREGMYIELDSPFKPNTKIRISGENVKTSSRMKSCHAKVRWCEKIKGAVVLYSYGIGILVDKKDKFSKITRNFKVIEGGAKEKK